MTRAARFAFSFSLLAWGAGCSFVEPHKGSLQAECGIESSTDGQMGSGYPMATANSTQAAPTCAAVPDSACDNCESTHCCATRAGCYGDPVCACADLKLDECLDDAEASAGETRRAEVSACWSAFAATGAAEQARISCQRSWCETECSMP